MADITIDRTFQNRMVANIPDTIKTDLLIGAAGSVSRGVVLIPFTGLPSGATITAAKLQLYLASITGSNNRTLRAYRCKRVVTASVTWNKYDGSNAWGTAGAGNTTTDREASDIGNRAFTTGDSTGQYYDITLTAAKIQEMFTGVFTNNGLILQMDTEVLDQYNFHVGGNARWALTYTLPAGGKPMFFSGGVAIG